MKKIKFQLPTKYQIIDVIINNNKLFLLDVDQKVIIVDFEFLNSDAFGVYDEVSIYKNQLQ